MAGPAQRRRERWVPWLLAVTVIAGAYALAIAWSGGFTVRVAGVRLRSHSWIRPAGVALAGTGLLLHFARARVAAMLAAGSRAAESIRVTTVLAIAASSWAVAAGIGFGTFAIGGADSYGYVGQARLFANGRVTDTIPVSPEYSWPDAAATFTPLGFSPGREPGVIAPKYPPGLPLLMAPLTRMSDNAVYFLVPVFGGLLIWITFRLGAAFGDPLAGALAAVLLSVSPTFLYQVVQPMSDVPAAACWLGALLAASRATSSGSARAGLMSSLAILIRPNLAPLAAIIFVLAALSGPRQGSGQARSRLRRAVAFGAALVPGLLLLGWIQNVRYGSPGASGYGTLSDAFAGAFIRENLARYPRWLTETHTWFIWLSAAAPVWIVRRAERPLLAWAALALAAAVWASYLPYLYFHQDEWFYTRFLLPAIAVMLLYATALALWPLRHLPATPRVPIIVILFGALVVNGVHAARTHGAFDIRIQERKYPLAGSFVREHLPPTALVLAAQHSGSIRYYADRPTFRWELLSPTRLDQALATFRAQGYEPFLVVDGGEYREFKERFDATGQRASQHPELLAIVGDARVYAFP
jgi:hypothetical protein